MQEHPDSAFGTRPGVDNLGEGSPYVDTNRLREAMAWSAEQLRPFRDEYLEAIELYGGSRYGHSDLDKTPVNLLRLAVEIWIRQLVSQSPRGLVLARSPVLQTTAYELETALNHVLREISFGRTLGEVSRSALFMMGIAKVGITSPYLAEGLGWTAEGGQPYADSVLFEDFIFDMNARRLEEWDYCGNRYRLPYDLVMENPDFDKKVLSKLSPDDNDTDTDGLSGDHRSNRLSSGESISKTEYRRHVELWDIWLPGDNLLVTMPVQRGLGALQIREWTGREAGPFRVLSFSQVPGNIVPSSPVQQLYDLQTLITSLFNLIGRQADRQRTLLLANGRAVADGSVQRIQDAADGEVVRVDHPEDVKEIRFGGADAQTMQFLIFAKQLFSYLAGNLDAMGGLAQQAGTLGQEQLLVQSSSEMLRDMQGKVVDFVKDCMTDIAWYLYTNPVDTLKLSKDISGYGKIPFTWSPAQRDSDFLEFNFELSPYSLQSKSPQQRLQTILQMMQQVLIPLSPQMSAWGRQLDLNKFVDVMAKYSDLPEIAELVTSNVPKMGDAIQGGEPTPGRRPLQSPNTTRNYTRTNITPGNIESQMMSALTKAQGA